MGEEREEKIPEKLFLFSRKEKFPVLTIPLPLAFVLRLPA
jgi:hypothetical protein